MSDNQAILLADPAITPIRQLSATALGIYHPLNPIRG
jgi:hypothetical protein